jgi:ATP-binding cassette subfamily B protein
VCSASKILDLFVPVCLKYAIDDLSNFRFPTTALILYGVFRWCGDGLVELRTVLYTFVSAKIEKRIASDVFRHLQALGLRYHLGRKTGSVLRSVSRGAAAFAEVARLVLFQFLPVFIQVGTVCGYLLYNYTGWFAVVTFLTILIFAVLTISTTPWRDQFRRAMMAKDNEFNQRATDALLNFETVKYFCAEGHEQARYEQALQEYRVAQIDAQKAMSVLNLGQNFVISVGVVVAMWIAAGNVLSLEIRVSDFVLINQFILTVRLFSYVSMFSLLNVLIFSVCNGSAVVFTDLHVGLDLSHRSSTLDRRRVHVQNLC